MTSTCKSALPHGLATETNFQRKHPATLATVAALAVLLSGVVAIRLWIVLGHTL